MQCPVCLAEASRALDEGWASYRTAHCQSCDVVFSDPMRAPDREWYETDEERAIYKAHEAFEGELGWNHKQFLADHIPAGTLLDVGCGTGTFLSEARSRGYVVSGIDFDRLNIELARSRFRLTDVQAGTVEEFASTNAGRRFDVITFFEVLEHLAEPRTFLAIVRSLLKPGGYVAISVPNRERSIDTIADLDRPPYHLTRWTRRALETVLHLEGFELQRMVVKPIGSEDLIDTLRLGLGRRLIRAGTGNGRPGLLSCAARLYRFKHKLIGVLAAPIAWLLRSFGFRGTCLYCLARVRDGKENEVQVTFATLQGVSSGS